MGSLVSNRNRKNAPSLRVFFQSAILLENFDLEEFDGEELINEAEDTMTILSKYVQSMEIDQQKELDILMKSLYTESLAVETV